MNLEEGHLGGYIRSRHSAEPTQLRLEHGDDATWCPTLWDWCFEALGVRSVLDVGCGEGHSTAYFRDLGCRVRGVDGSQQARRDSRVPEAHLVHDFTRGVYLPGEDYDMVWCCEFVEHVEECYAPNFLETFRAASHWLLMTHAVPGQRGHHHVNLQQAGYWIERVEALGFRWRRDLTEVSRGVAQGHYRSHGLLFARA